MSLRVLEPDRLEHQLLRRTDVVEDVQRPPVGLRHRRDRLRRELRRRDVQERVGPGRRQLAHLRRDRRVGHLVALARDDLDVRALDRLLEAAQQVLAEAVVLVQHGDLRVRLLGLEELRVGLRLRDVVRLPAGRVRVRLDVSAPVRRAGGDEHVRDLLLVRVVPDRQVVRRPERVEQREHLVLLDQAADVGHRALRLVAVVERDELDLAPVDAALGVLGREARLGARRDARVRRRRAAERVRAAELDRRVGDARRRRGAFTSTACGIVLLTAPAPGRQQQDEQRRHRRQPPHVPSLLACGRTRRAEAAQQADHSRRQTRT